MHVALAVAAPLGAIAVWSLFVAPKAVVKVSEPVRWLIELIVFATSAAALASAGQLVLGVVLGVVALANGFLVRALEARGQASASSTRSG